MSSLVFRTSLLFAIVLLLGNCPPPPPPVINEFTVVPTNQCATVPVAVVWAADAASGRLTVTPAITPPPPDPLPSLSRGGFRFDTTTTDPTTYTLTVERGGNTATATRSIRIVPNPFTLTVQLDYNCTERSWGHPGFSDREYGETITVQSFTNMGRDPLLLEFGGQTTELPPGQPARLLSPVRLPGGSWRARLANGTSPICTGPGSTGGGSSGTPPPVQISVTSFCPTR